MKAIVQHRYGSPDVLALEEIAKPEPREGEVLLRVHASSVNALPAAAGSGVTLNWYPTTAHLVQLVVSQPGACDGAASEAAPVTFGDVAPGPSPAAGLRSQAPAVTSTSTPSPTPPASAGGAGTGSGGACVGPICAPSFPDLGQVISSAIVSGLTTLLADVINALSGLITSIITWATAGSLCTTTGTGSSTFTLLSGTPPCLTWTNPYVQTYATLCRAIALALVALLICLHGLEVALATRAGHTFAGSHGVARG